MLAIPKVWKGIAIDVTPGGHNMNVHAPRGYCGCGCCSFTGSTGCR